MLLTQLKEAVLEANLELVRRGLVMFTWGNVSGVDRERGLVAIKPSGVSYEHMKVRDIVVLDLSGQVVEGDLTPSSDMPTHLALYNAFPQMGAIVHTHSTWATIWAQACRPVPCLGTTHADTFYGEIPCTREMTPAEINGAYEQQTGNVMIEALQARGGNPMDMPGILVAQHGPFSWGRTPAEAVYHAAVLEQVAQMAHETLLIHPQAQAISQSLRDRHFFRKHGPNAYYGQGERQKK